MIQKLTYSCMILFASICLQAQNPDYSMGISFKKLFMDYQSQNGGSLGAIKDYHHGFEIGFHKRIARTLNVVIPFKYGNVNDSTVTGCLHKKVAGLDAQFQYQFLSTGSKIVPYLMAGIGGVYEFSGSKDGSINAQVPLGFGLNFRAADNAWINFQSEYRYSFKENRNNLHHGIGFVYLFGKKGEEDVAPVEPLDNNDSDGDGIENKLDLCPDEAGPSTLNGCPDTDGDGIADFKDKCPSISGLKSLDGCPDSDGDGVADNDDECPNLAGVKDNKGCPKETKISDRDGDGIMDSDDNCPDMPGLLSNKGCPEKKVSDRDGDGVEDSIDKCPDLAGKGINGCPEADRDMDGTMDKADRCPDVKGLIEMSGCPDTDGDGIADPDDKCPRSAGLKVYSGCPDSDGDGLDDSIDKCPNTPGTVASGGCPDIAIEDRKTLDIAMRAVQFDTGLANFKLESFTILKQIANILNKYPDYNLAISGHTDNSGSAVANQELSEKRAKACYDFLISQGVVSSRMSYAGYGESRPVADNESLNGKSLNRRVEFALIPR